MTALHWALAAALVGLLVLRAPLPPVLRLLLPFSFLFGYEYVVVARSYGLTALCLLLAAALRGRPALRGLAVGLLANTNAHGFFIAFGLGLGLAADLHAERSRRRAAETGLALALGVLALWQLYPTGEGTEYARPSSPLALVWTVGDGLVPFVPGAPGLLDHGPAAVGALAHVLGWGVLAAVVAGTTAPRARASLVVALAGLLFIFGFRYWGSVRHHGLFQALFAWALWVERDAAAERAPPAWAARALQAAVVGWVLALVAGLPTVLRTWQLEATEPFSGSREAARFLIANGLDAGDIAAHPPNGCMAVLPYLRARTLWYAALEAHGSHMIWDRGFNRAEALPVEEAARRTACRFPPGTCLLLRWPLPDARRLGFELVFRSSRLPFRYDEVYWIYRLVERPPDAR